MTTSNPPKASIAGGSNSADESKKFNLTKLESFLSRAYHADLEQYKKDVQDVRAILNGASVKQEGEGFKTFLNKLKGNENTLWFFRLYLDRNPSLSDDLWIDFALENGNAQANPENGETDYDRFFTATEEFATTTIVPNVFDRKIFRSSLPKEPEKQPASAAAHAGDLIGDIPLPKYSHYQDMLAGQKEEFALENNHKLVTLKKALENMKTTDKQKVGLVARLATLPDEPNKPPFSSFFLEYINKLHGGKPEDVEEAHFLVEIFVDALYFVLDGTVPPPFSSMKAVKRDWSYHRLTRFFFIIGAKMKHLSDVIVGMHADWQTELSWCLLNEDRTYLHDGYLQYGMKKVIGQGASGYSPFNQAFGATLGRESDLNKGFNRDIPLYDDEKFVPGEDADPLQKLISEDENFRNLTKRQVEEWYSTKEAPREDGTPGGIWESSYEAIIEPKHFNQRKGNIIFKYYLPPTVKQFLQDPGNADQGINDDRNMRGQ